ncbi:DUF1467 family protein [Lichenihabitans sp. PAMC28606]|uniref:DUF1467 family protein n=1 Tax=Lichenihabitans sp. PAMC28606 TaxID=2880932 RepID=UPI001D0AE2B4|nr:DUF1467 family protein [Lichenihabitans sp. PAMC28606]UDL95146.1 DUF1467 family protein [Lichenihabitans sp. PAMC28606]
MPIPTPMAIAIYFTMWWIVLFAVLPFGVRSQQESGSVVPGSEPGAPETPGLKKKALWTTVISAALFVALMLLIKFTD